MRRPLKSISIIQTIRLLIFLGCMECMNYLSWMMGMGLERRLMGDARRYSVLPIRAIGIVKKGRTFRVLAALCAHASPAGICYPNQERLMEMTGVHQADISRAIYELWMLGLVRYLEPKGEKHKNAYQRGNRYQVLYAPNAPLPSPLEREIPPGCRTKRWDHHLKRGGTGE